MYSLKPIGFLKSPFTFKNGTPRQPSVCQMAKGIITIDKDVFNNPEHSLEGLDDFSHVWIFFIFHKNNNVHTKAKVKPPRLNGKKTGVFSTRSPYRPNNVGLTLAKIEHVSGACLTVSGIDILDGTPIIDLKPYIPQYDCPAKIECADTMFDEFNGDTDINSETTDCEESNTLHNTDSSKTIERQFCNEGAIWEDLYFNQKNPSDAVSSSTTKDETMSDVKPINDDVKKKTNVHFEAESTSYKASTSRSENQGSILEGRQHLSVPCEDLTKLKLNVTDNADSYTQNQCQKPVSENMSVCETKDCDVKISDTLATADWIVKSPVAKLDVRLTTSAEEQLKNFSCEDGKGDYKLQFLKDYDEVKLAITNILREDPRSTYRRKHCIDQLYYFTFDCIHVTCWFDDNFVEIVRVKPINQVEKLSDKIAVNSP